MTRKAIYFLIAWMLIASMAACIISAGDNRQASPTPDATEVYGADLFYEQLTAIAKDK